MSRFVRRHAAVLREAGRYGLSGGAAALTTLVALVGLVELAGLARTPSSALAFALGSLVNYALQHRFVFGSTRGHATALPRYLGVTAGTLALNTGLFWCLVGQGLPYPLAQVVTIGLIVPVNFLLNRSFTFGRFARQPA